MPDLFDSWFTVEITVDGKKSLRRAKELSGKRPKVLHEIARRTRSHYVSDEEVAAFLDALDYHDAAEVLRTQYPEEPRGRSADLGEILGTEIIEEWCDHKVPIRKLRDKDHREQAMRGEDIIGIRIDKKDRLCLLKGEAKSARSLAEATVIDARESLEANSGRPSAHSLIFIGRRLIDSNVEETAELGKRLLAESVQHAVPKSRMAHCLFALTGNKAGDMLDSDFETADSKRDQHIVHLRVNEHGSLVEAVFDRVNALALD